MTITPDQIRLLAEAQRENPELDLLGVTDAGREWLRVNGGEWVSAGALRKDDRFNAARSKTGTVHRFGEVRTVSGNPCVWTYDEYWVIGRDSEWVEAGGKACKVRVRRNAANDRTEMQCTHIDERLRGKKCRTKGGMFTASSGMQVASYMETAIDIHTVWLRGRHCDLDNEVVIHKGNHVAAIIAAVNEANAAWEKELEAMDKPSPSPDLLAEMRELLDRLEHAMRLKA